MDIHLLYATRHESPRKEAASFGATVAGSMVLHVAAAVALLTAAEHVLHIPAERIITVDLSVVEPLPPAAPTPPVRPSAKTVTAVLPTPVVRPVPARTASVRTEPSLPSRQPVESPGRTAETFSVPPIAPIGGTSPTAPVSHGMTMPAPAPPAPQQTVSRRDEPVRHGPATTTRTIPDSMTSSARTRYQALLRNLIEKEKEYPLFARKAGLQGVCLVACSLRRDGRIVSVTVKKSSGHAILDRAALSSVEKTGRFPAVPAELSGDTTSFEIPISYALDR